MIISRFDPLTAKPSHEGTILADAVVPECMNAPFDHAYGYLMKGRSMMGHAHPTDEIYIVISGSGHVIVGGRNLEVKSGDIVAIPPDTWHTMICTESDNEPFLWAAFWWPHLDGGEPFGEEIAVQRFRVENATGGHNNTLLADYVVPPQLKTPFGNAYGYLTKGGAMEAHEHHEYETYIILNGTGLMTVGEESETVTQGDVIAIPPDVIHSLSSDSDELLWAAFWWDVE